MLPTPTPLRNKQHLNDNASSYFIFPRHSKQRGGFVRIHWLQLVYMWIVRQIRAVVFLFFVNKAAVKAAAERKQLKDARRRAGDDEAGEGEEDDDDDAMGAKKKKKKKTARGAGRGPRAPRAVAGGDASSEEGGGSSSKQRATGKGGVQGMGGGGQLGELEDDDDWISMSDDASVASSISAGMGRARKEWVTTKAAWFECLQREDLKFKRIATLPDMVRTAWGFETAIAPRRFIALDFDAPRGGQK